MNQNSKSGGIVTESIAPQINGHASADPFSGPSEVWAAGTGVQDDREASEDAAVWIPDVMLADHLDAASGDVISEVVDEDVWQAFRGFKNRYNIAITRETVFGEIGVVPAGIAHACGLEPTLADVAEFIDNYGYPLPDPCVEGDRLEAERFQRFHERDTVARELKPQGIAPDTEYSLSEVERVCGAQVAEKARLAIEQCNRRAWSHPKPHNFREHTYLLTAGELVGLDASATDIAAMKVATADDRDAALEQLAVARQRHRDDITARARTGDVPALDLAAEVLTVSGLAALEPVRPLIEGFIPGGQLIDLNGQPGSGKTMAAVSMAAAVASGTRWCGHAVEKRAAVLYVAAEGAAGIRARLLAWCEVNDVAPKAIEDTFIIAPRAVQMGDDNHMQQVRDLVKKHNVALVVFDTRARCTVGVEENSATDHGRVISRADDINQQTGAAVLVVHHTAAGSERARGTTAWDGGVWSSLLLARVGGKTSTSRKIQMTCAKHKEWPDKCTHQFKLVEHTVDEALMRGATASQRSTLVLTGVDPMTMDDDEAQSTGETHAEILALTAELGGGEGLTKAEIVKFALERNLCSRSGAYAAITALTDKGKKLVKVPGTQRLAARDLIDGVPDDTDGITAVGSPTYTAAVDAIIENLCLRKAEGRITDDTAKTDAHKLVGGHVVPFAEAWTRWSANRPTDLGQVDKLKSVGGQ